MSTNNTNIQTISLVLGFQKAGCTIFQAEISDIKILENWLRYNRISGMYIRTYTDSQAAIKSLIGVYTTSSLYQHCRASLCDISRHFTVLT